MTIVFSVIVLAQHFQSLQVETRVKLRGHEYDLKILKTALEATAKKRGSVSVVGEYESIMTDIRNSSRMHNFWTNYQKEFDYTKELGLTMRVTLLLCSCHPFATCRVKIGKNDYILKQWRASNLLK